MHCRIFTYLVALATIFNEADAGLSNTPQDAESKIGDTTYFNCSTNLTSKEILWNHGDQYVYSEDGILPPYHERFEIDRNASIGSYNLVIHSVEPGDAGEYICIDDDGHGIRRSAQLIVLDADPDCQSNIQPDGVIGQNVFNIPPDEVQLTCNVTYHGNIPPQMEWRKVGDNSSTEFNVTSQLTSYNRLTHTLNLMGDISLDKSSYVCQTKRSRQKQYKCSSEDIKVLYVIGEKMTERIVFRGDEITCIYINNTFPCTREWHHDNYTCPLPCSETITTHLPGEFLCKTKCNVRGTEYFFTTLKVFVVEVPTSPKPSASGTITASVVVPIVVIALVVFIAAFAVRRINGKGDTTDLIVSDAAANALIQERAQYAREKFETDEVALNELLKQEVRAIYGLAVLGQELFISRLQYPDIEVYDSSTFRYKRQMEVDGMLNPEHVVSCSVNNCLYAVDWVFREESCEILRINPVDGNLINSWKVYEGGGRMSVAKDTNVILNINYKIKLYEYTAEGELIREIDLSEGTRILRAWHAVKLPNDLFVVCHGDYDDPLSRVCLLSPKSISDAMGRIEKVEIVKIFGAGPGDSINRLKRPMYLSVDNKGSILVSDAAKQSVLLSSNFDKPKILFSEKDGMGTSWRTCFDESTNQWFVCDYHRVMVCRVKDNQVERKLQNLITNR